MHGTSISGGVRFKYKTQSLVVFVSYSTEPFDIPEQAQRQTARAKINSRKAYITEATKSFSIYKANAWSKWPL